MDNLYKARNQDIFIQELSDKHKVRVDTVNIKLFASRIRQFYILSVMQQAEQFIEEFRKEYKSYKSEWTNKIDGETDFDNLLSNIFSSKGRGINAIGKEVYHGLEYYRLVRNRFAHSEEKDVKKLNSYCERVIEYKDFYNGTFHSISGPNKYGEIDFNDFLLCTNIIKNIGYTLCKESKPDNSQLAERISKFEIVTQKNKTVNVLKNIFKLKNDPKRFINAIDNLLNTNFGRINKSDRDEIVTYLQRILA